MDDNIPDAMTSPLTIDRPNLPVGVFSGEIEVLNSGAWVKGSGRIELRWLPKPRLAVEVKSYTPLFSLPSSLDAPDARNMNFWVPDLGINFEASLLLRRQASESYRLTEYTVVAELLSPFTLGAQTTASYAEISLVNFRSYHGKPIKQPQRGWDGELKLSYEGWDLTIHSPWNRDELEDALDVEGGYAVTHVARLERADRSTFSASALDTTWVALSRYLSLLAGKYVNTCLVVARDASSSKVWETWGMLGEVSSWKQLSTWMPGEVPKLGSSVVQFMRLNDDENWAEVLDTCISWYVQSQNSDDVSASVLFAHLAIELLAWAEFVEINHVIGEGSFRKMDAAERIRLLLHRNGIPTDIPSKLVNLEAHRKSQKNQQTVWDGPKAIAEFRNQLAHPNLRHKLRDFSLATRAEIKQLALWYVELCLLRLLNYDDVYFSRVDSAYQFEVQALPWKKGT